MDEVLADDEVETTRRPGRPGPLPIGIAVVGLAIVLYFTLFPFDLVNGNGSLAEVVGRFRLTTGSVWNWRAVPANVVMVVPFGAGVAAILVERAWSRRAVIGAGVAAGLVLSVLLELAQAAWLLRLPSFDDIVANTLGAGVGAWLWIRFGPRVAAAVQRIGGSVTTGRGRLLVPGLALVPIVLVLLVTARTRHDTEPLGWDPSDPLVLGNEATGDRPWRGSISEVVLADRTFTEQEVAAWLAGEPMTDPESEPGVLLALDVSRSAEIPAGWEVRGSTTEATPAVVDGRLELGPDRWLQTVEPVEDVSRAIEGSGSFTVAVDAASAAPDQSGPARLVSISIDPYQRNLTLAQDGADLVVRVRSSFTGAGGDVPEYAVHDVFADGRARRIVVTYDAAAVRVSVDDVASTTTIGLQPDTVPMAAMFPDEIARIRFSAIGNPAREAFLAAFMFGPWCVCVGLLQRRRALGPAASLLAVAPVLGVELLLTWLLPLHSFRVVHVLVVGVAAWLVAASVAAWSGRSGGAAPVDPAPTAEPG